MAKTDIKFQSTLTDTTLREGTRLGDYEIIRNIGKGGQGDVYKVKFTAYDESVDYAIKMVPFEQQNNHNYIERLKKEIRVTEKLSHPNIIKTYRYEKFQGYHFIVMEYIEGYDLHEYMKQKGGRLKLNEAIGILKDVAEALDYAHALQKPVIHCDLKPGNLIWDINENKLKIIDFGIAHEIQRTLIELNKKALVSGTKPYMCYEQASGENPTDKMDIYSFAVILYECLNGKPPFTQGDITYQHQNVEVPDIPNVSQVVMQVLKKALSKDPQKRYIKATDFIRDLQGKRSHKISKVIEEDNTEGVNKNDKRTKMEIFDDIIKNDHFDNEKEKFEAYIENFEDIQEASYNKDPLGLYHLAEYRKYKGEINIAHGLYEEAAHKGHIDSQFITGERYLKDNAEEDKQELAYKWISSAAEAGNVDAMYFMGECYFYGLGFIEKDPQKAYSYFSKAAKANDIRAAYMLAGIYNKGDIITGDIDLAIKWYNKAAQNNHKESQYELAKIYEERKKYEKSFQMYERAAHQGMPDAQYKVAEKYISGLGVKKDLNLGLEMLLLAVEALHKEAILMLMDLYLIDGIKINIDQKKLTDYMKIAAHNGHVEAMFALSQYYASGKNVKKSKKQQIAYLHKASMLEHENATEVLVKMILDHEDTGLSESETSKLVLQAAKQENVDAQYEIACRYDEGGGVTQSKKDAMFWYRKASGNGHIESHYRLAQFYLEGYYCKKDIDTAFELLDQASLAGHLEAAYQLAELNLEEDSPESNKQAFKLLSQNAKRDHAPSLHHVSKMYLNGTGCRKNKTLAFNNMLQAAEMDHIDSYIEIARYYSNGIGIKEDKESAELWYKKAIGSGSVQAIFELAKEYSDGDSYSKRSIELLKEASEKGHKEAETIISELILSGKNIGLSEFREIKLLEGLAISGKVDAQLELAKRYKKENKLDDSVIWLKLASDQGNVNAILELCDLILNPVKLKISQGDEIKYLTKASINDYIPAQVELAERYRLGNGIVKSQKAANELYIKAAEKGSIIAQYELGIAYYTGNEIKKNIKKAVEQFSKAAEGGHQKAQYELAKCYMEGIGIEKDEDKGIEWFKKSFERGNISALIELCILMNMDKKIEDNPYKEFNLIQKGVDEDIPIAQLLMAKRLSSGNGATKDDAKALEWYKKAASNNNTEAVKYIIQIISDKPDIIGKEEFDKHILIKAIDLDIADAHYALSKILEQDGKKNEAKIQYKLALKNGSQLAKKKRNLRIIINLILTLALAVFTLFAVDQVNKYRDRKYIEFLNKGNSELSLNEFDSALKTFKKGKLFRNTTEINERIQYANFGCYIEYGDEFFEKEDFKMALYQYELAGAYQYNDDLSKKISNTQDQINIVSRDSLVLLGDQSYKKGDLKGSIEFYNLAIEKYPLNKKEEIKFDKYEDELKKDNENKAEFNSLITLAREEYKNKNFKNVVELYNKAKKYYNLLNEDMKKLALAKNTLKYNDYIASAEKAFLAFQMDIAYKAYKSANELFPLTGIHKDRYDNLKKKIFYRKYVENYNLVYIGKGSLVIGSYRQDASYNEKPAHTVYINDYHIADHEIIQEDFREIMGYNPSIHNRSKRRYPIENVTWYEAIEFCNKLSKKCGLEEVYQINNGKIIWNRDKKGFRLPTEAEWEYASRARKSASNFFSFNDMLWSGTNSIEELKYYANINSKSTCEVATKKPNTLGLYDMTGNVAEWCWDWYAKYDKKYVIDPMGNTYGTEKIIRGGGWNSNDKESRVSYRRKLAPDKSSSSVGFRIVLDK